MVDEASSAWRALLGFRLWDAALLGGLLIALVWLGRAALRRHIAPRWIYAAWGLVLVRLLIPFGAPSPTSALNWLNAPVERRAAIDAQGAGSEAAAVDAGTSEAATGEAGRRTEANGAAQTLPNIAAQQTLPNAGDGEAAGNAAHDEALPHTAPAPGTAATEKAWARAWTAIWASGALCVAGYTLWANLRFRRQIRDRRALRVACAADPSIPVYLSARVESPCLVGFFRPFILVPPRLAADDPRLRHVLLHETEHARRGDGWFALLRALACALYWFHPLVWLAARLSREDGEIACDAAVLRRLEEAEQLRYGETLLSLVAQRGLPARAMTSAMRGKKRALRERIQFIAAPPRNRRGAIVCACVLVRVCALTACTDRAAKLDDAGRGTAGKDAEGTAASTALPTDTQADTQTAAPDPAQAAIPGTSEGTPTPTQFHEKSYLTFRDPATEIMYLLEKQYPGWLWKWADIQAGKPEGLRESGQWDEDGTRHIVLSNGEEGFAYTLQKGDGAGNGEWRWEIPEGADRYSSTLALYMEGTVEYLRFVEQSKETDINKKATYGNALLSLGNSENVSLAYAFKRLASKPSDAWTAKVFADLCRRELGPADPTRPGEVLEGNDWYRMYAERGALQKTTMPPARVEDMALPGEDPYEALVLQVGMELANPRVYTQAVNIGTCYVYGSLEKDDTLLVWAKLRMTAFELYEYKLVRASSFCTPHKYVFKKGADGEWVFTERIPQPDMKGSKDSIAEFTREKPEIAARMQGKGEQKSAEEMERLLLESLYRYLRAHDFGELWLVEYDGTLVKLEY